jgi:hypothetical protein
MRNGPGYNGGHTPNAAVQNKRQRPTDDTPQKPLSNIIQQNLDNVSNSSNSISSSIFVDPPKRKRGRPKKIPSTGES